jgi:hypothetical protein
MNLEEECLMYHIAQSFNATTMRTANLIGYSITHMRPVLYPWTVPAGLKLP